MRRISLCFLSALVLVVCPLSSCNTYGEELVDEPPTTSADCGLRSLYLLLRMEELSPTLDEIRSHLPSTRPQGFSMLELREAASAMGLKLVGV